MRKTIGFYGGTFDPIHFGHINLSLQLSEIHQLDQVLFSPAFCSPFKAKMPPVALPMHRLEMVRIALERIPHFQIDTTEIELEKSSYTIDILKELKKKWGSGFDFRLLLSDDAAVDFEKWKDFKELIRIAPPLIGTRSPKEFQGMIKDILSFGLTKTSLFEISSTDIRSRLKKGLYCGHLVPEKVLQYIKVNRLYSAHD